MQANTPRVPSDHVTLTSFLQMLYNTPYLLFIFLALAVSLVACGGGSGLLNSSTVSNTVVTISPSSASVNVDGTQLYTASVTGATNKSVTWFVNGIQGGDSTVGTISSAGLFTAPSNAPSNPAETISATSEADPTKSGSAGVTIRPSQPGISVSVAPSSSTVQSTLTQQFTATITGTTNTAVTWSVNGIQGGNSTYGTISALGVFTAPASVPAHATVVINATSYQDPTKSGTASVLITPSPQSGVDYYVASNGSDSASGSANQPWATINHADAMVGPGAIVHVAPGTYTHAVNLTRSGTPSQPIVYVSDVKWAAKLVVSGSSDSCFYSGGSWVTIDGFDITENASTGSCRIGLRTEGAHVVVKNNYVHDINNFYADPNHQDTGGCYGQGGAGLLISSQVNPSYDTALVDSNVVDNIGATGASAAYTGHTCVRVHNYYLTISNMTAVNNISLRALGYGYTTGGHPPSQLTNNQVLINNVTIADGYGAFYLVCQTYDSSPCVVYAFNNIVDERWAGGILGFGGRSDMPAYGCVKAAYNIIYMPLGGNPYGYTPACSGYPAHTVGTTTTNPGFVTYTGKWFGGNYRLAPGSPAVDAGTGTIDSIIAPAQDADGNSRPQGSTWDLGAYEQ